MSLKDASDSTPRVEQGRTPVPSLASTTFGLCGLALAVPLLGILGPSATFFNSHGAGRSDVILFTAVLLLVVPAALLAALLLVRWLAPRCLGPVTHGLVGVLSVMVIVPVIHRIVRLSVPWYGLMALVIAVSVAQLHRRHAAVRVLVRLSSVIPVVVALWFLLFSSVSSIVLPQPAIAAAHARSNANVLLVILDELPVAALLRSDGSINEERFPGFAELSRRSTWYKRATTVAPWTNLAVPAILSGRVPIYPPSPGYYSRNLFSMLERTHELVPMEVVTRLCQGEACGAPPQKLPIYDDALIIYLHGLMPRDLAARWLPVIGDRWVKFGARDETSLVPEGEASMAEPVRFQRLFDKLRPRRDGRPTAWVAHFLLPHFPLKYLPDGRIYDSRPGVAGLRHGLHDWGADQSLIDVGRQRFLLQLRYTDTFVTRLMEVLQESALYDDTMVIVTADHGLSFQPGNRRGAPYTSRKAPEILPIPLFVKYPGQKIGSIETRPVQSIDIAPTVADSLDVVLPTDWTFDGVSLRQTDGVRQRPMRYFDGGPVVTPPRVTDPSPIVRTYEELFGVWRDEHDTYAWGPYWRLFGKSPQRSRFSMSNVSANLASDDIRSFRPRRGQTLALVELILDRKPSEQWLALSLNGTVAGLGRTYRDSRGEYRGIAMIDPTYLRAGRNDVQAYLVTASGELSRFEMVTTDESSGE